MVLSKRSRRIIIASLAGLSITGGAVGYLLARPNQLEKEMAKYKCVIRETYHSTRSDDPGLLALKECYEILDVEDECRPTSSSLNCKDAAKSVLTSLKSDKESLNSKALKESGYLDLARKVFQLESKMDNYLRFDPEHRAFHKTHASSEDGIEESFGLAQEGVALLDSMDSYGLEETHLASYLNSTLKTLVDYQLLRTDEEYHDIDCPTRCDFIATLWRSNCDEAEVFHSLSSRYDMSNEASKMLHDEDLLSLIQCQRDEKKRRRKANYQAVKQALAEGYVSNSYLVKLAEVEEELLAIKSAFPD